MNDFITPGGPLERYLVRKAQQGDGEAFKQLIASYNKRIGGLIHVILDDQCQEQDAMQESLFAIWKNLPKFDYMYGSKLKNDMAGEYASLWAWMSTIIARCCIRVRKHKPLQPYPLPEGASEPIDKKQSDRSIIVMKLDIEVALKKLEQVEPKYALVLRLRYLADWKIIDIANLLDTNVNTIKTWIRKALKEMRKLLGDNYYLESPETNDQE